MGKKFLKVIGTFALGLGCYLGFVPLFIFIQKHSPVSYDWILELSKEMQVYAAFGQKFITELVVAVPLILIAGIFTGLISGYNSIKYGLIACLGMFCSYAYFFVSRGRWNEPLWFFTLELIAWVVLLIGTTFIGVKIRRPKINKTIPTKQPGDHFDDVYLP